ncbi:MAG: hypothetical protein NVS3B16_03590 [Vulcanimicrobiaceae bacterium]
MHRFSAAAYAVAFAAAAAGCSGGGGGSPTPPAPPGPPPIVSTQAPITTPGGGTASLPPASANTSTLSIQSNPAGLAVTIVSGGATTMATTPTSTTPRASNLATQVSIAPSNGAPAFTFFGDQRGNGNRTVFYNQAADTNGSIGSISATSAGRRVDASSAAADNALPRFTSLGASGRPAYSTTRLVVRYRAASLASAGRRPLDLERAAGIERGIDVGPANAGVLARIVDVPAGTAIADVAAQLRARPEVASATPERLYYKETSTAVTPNDPRFDNYQQWSEFAIKAPGAWGYTLGSPAVAIAVIDTGADFNHPDFAGAKITYAESVLNGRVTTGSAAAQDTDGHGTNVAGIAAADTNNAFAYAGTGYNSSLQIYKVFSDGTAANKYAPAANSGDVSQAIYDAVAHGANVINLSLGSCQAQGADPVQRDAVSFALSRNVVVVAAAGNERAGTSGDPACSGGSSTVDFPAAYDGVIAVGASKLDDTAMPMVFASAIEKVASYSNSGPGLSLVAPGGDPTAAEASAGATTANLLHWIAGLYTSTAADPNAQCRNKAECKALFAGTSQASPHVAGVAALMLAARPGLSAAQVKTALMATADDIGDPNQGAGRLDAYRALAAVTGDPLPPAQPTNANFVAIAYVPNGTNVPQILNVTYPLGVPVASNGTFRIADIPATATGYKIGVWYDANGDGKVDAGDYFGSSGPCSATAPCTSAAGIVVRPVANGFVLN